MSAVVLLAVALCVFALAYRYYAAFGGARPRALLSPGKPASRMKNG